MLPNSGDKGRNAGMADAEQLRTEIDRGQTGDEIAWPDPAVVPLGTDDEAAGVRTDEAELHAARQSELDHSKQAVRQDHWTSVAEMVGIRLAGAAAVW